MTRIAAVFETSGIELDDLGLARPSLDDVFLHLTGHRAEAEPDDRRPTDPTTEGVTPVTAVQTTTRRRRSSGRRSRRRRCCGRRRPSSGAT